MNSSSPYGRLPEPRGELGISFPNDEIAVLCLVYWADEICGQHISTEEWLRKGLAQKGFRRHLNLRKCLSALKRQGIIERQRRFSWSLTKEGRQVAKDLHARGQFRERLPQVLFNYEVERKFTVGSVWHNTFRIVDTQITPERDFGAKRVQLVKISYRCPHGDHLDTYEIHHGEKYLFKEEDLVCERTGWRTYRIRIGNLCIVTKYQK